MQNFDPSDAHDQELDIQDIEDDDQTIPFRYSISSYGADYPVDGLVRRLSDGGIYIPIFQRGFVWSYSQSSKFIESLLLGLPVPGIFLSKELDTQKLLVIDGQQRLRTLQFFYKGIFAESRREFFLKGVQSKFEGKTYETLSDEDRRKLDDSILHATIVRQEEPSDDESSIYHIFERLNTGGTQLNPQEIRASIFIGEFNDLLGELNRNNAWRGIFGSPSKRKRDQELILRFLSLYFYGANYSRPMKEFLNVYMGKNRHLQMNSTESIENVFVNTIETIHSGIGRKAFKPARALNAAIFDSVTIAVARRLEKGPIEDLSDLQRKYDSLLEDDEFIQSTGRATADEESVKHRINLATEALAQVQ